ncbi:MAG: transcriptional regulator [Candidatus Heimdallarchaeota archaeon]|nr:transcriptional regulator [Candidatus Heimdallarchaeota archaeon]
MNKRDQKLFKIANFKPGHVYAVLLKYLLISTAIHSSKLEEAGYIKITKLFREKKPVTILEITEKGIKAFENYRSIMQGVLGD